MYHTLLTDYMDQAALTWGDDTAIEAPDRTIGYATFRREARALAARLLAFSGSGAQPIALYLPKGVLCVVGMAAALYSGNFYAPLDVRAPIPYLVKSIERLECKIILTDQAGEKKLAQAGLHGLAVRVDVPSGEPEDPPALSHAVEAGTDCDPAFVLFTSGSTGVPKGVVIPHRRVMDYVEWAKDYFGCGHQTVIGNQAPFLFTVSVLDLYLCFAAGAKLCLIPESTLASPGDLIRYLNEKRVNFVFWVPSLYKNVAVSGCLTREQPAFLKSCLFVGEPMPVPVLNTWMEHLPQTRFYHLYGTTETDMAACYPVTEAPFVGDALPLGRARKNVRVLILDEQGKPVQVGEVGEICVSGSTLACGYWKQPESRSFTVTPDGMDRMYKTGDLGAWDKNGTIIFHGRRDHQFKHMGYRLEAVGIERIAMGSGLLEDACICYQTERQQIVLFYVPDKARGDVKRELQRYLLGALPAYMLPTRLLPLDAMPATPNGKKDRVALGLQAQRLSDST